MSSPQAPGQASSVHYVNVGGGSRDVDEISNDHQPFLPSIDEMTIEYLGINYISFPIKMSESSYDEDDFESDEETSPAIALDPAPTMLVKEQLVQASSLDTSVPKGNATLEPPKQVVVAASEETKGSVDSSNEEQKQQHQQKEKQPVNIASKTPTPCSKTPVSNSTEVVSISASAPKATEKPTIAPVASEERATSIEEVPSARNKSASASTTRKEKTISITNTSGAISMTPDTSPSVTNTTTTSVLRLKIQEQKATIENLEAANRSLEMQVDQYSETLRREMIKAKTAHKRPSRPQPSKASASSSSKAHLNQMKEKQYQSLVKKMEMYKRSNVELKNQLSQVYHSEMYTQLENAVQEKQHELDALLMENRTLQHVQRTQEKRIEELETIRSNLPFQLQMVMDDLRVCKERLKGYKEREKKMDTRSSNTQKQVIALTKKNAQLLEQVQAHTDTSRVNKSDQALSQIKDTLAKQLRDQLEENQKFKHKIQKLQKLRKQDQAQVEKVLASNENQLSQCRDEIEQYRVKFTEKERDVRAQVMHVRKLKRQLKDLVAGTDENRDMVAFLQRTSERFHPSSSSLAQYAPELRKVAGAYTRSSRAVVVESPRKKPHVKTRGVRAKAPANLPASSSSSRVRQRQLVEMSNHTSTTNQELAKENVMAIVEEDEEERRPPGEDQELELELTT